MITIRKFFFRLTSFWIISALQPLSYTLDLTWLLLKRRFLLTLDGLSDLFTKVIICWKKWKWKILQYCLLTNLAIIRNHYLCDCHECSECGDSKSICTNVVARWERIWTFRLRNDSNLWFIGKRMSPHVRKRNTLHADLALLEFRC